ncbi:MAG TPA: HEPN domain-containing protein [Terriglobales bacterium]|jgi:HEPN domain-containing protein|nr:HEPN domain-containing protein [Terriglobales bacterium]
MSAPERDPLQWLLRAQSDLLNIDNNLTSLTIPWDTMVFHAQQVCEKLLKAVVVQKGNVPPRSHDLVLLLNMCPEVTARDTSLPQDMDKLMLLFGSRYPDTKWPSETEGRNSVAIARRLANIIVPMIKTKP